MCCFPLKENTHPVVGICPPLFQVVPEGGNVLRGVEHLAVVQIVGLNEGDVQCLR